MSNLKSIIAAFFVLLPQVSIAEFTHQDFLRNEAVCTVRECIAEDNGNSFLKFCREASPAPFQNVNILWRQSINSSQRCYCPCNIDMQYRVERERIN